MIADNSTRIETVPIQLPVQLVKLVRRLNGLEDGRYQIILTVEDGKATDWTVDKLGKVERAVYQ